MSNIEAEYFHVDAFAENPFEGNPASICFMSTKLSEDIYFSIARELNLVSEMAVIEEENDGCYNIRWFSKKKEVPLCGHATLAAAHVIFYELNFSGEQIEFLSESGSLYAKRTKKGIQLDFPVNMSHSIDAPIEVIQSIGIDEWVDVQYSPGNQKLMIHLNDYETLKSVEPDFDALLEAENPLGWRAVMITSSGFNDYDFVSRHFAPHVGVNEDPVTGSNHTVLTPYWSKILGKNSMKAYQASKRGGVLYVELNNERVMISGKSVTILKGNIIV